MRIQCTVNLEPELYKKLPQTAVGRNGNRSAWIARAIEHYLAVSEGQEGIENKGEGIETLTEMLGEQSKKQLSQADAAQKQFLQIGKHGEMNPAFRFKRKNPPPDERKARAELLKEREERAQVASKLIVFIGRIRKLQKWWIN